MLSTGWTNNGAWRLPIFAAIVVILTACRTASPDFTPTAVRPTSSFTRSVPVYTDTPVVPSVATPTLAGGMFTETPFPEATATAFPSQPPEATTTTSQPLQAVSVLPDSQLYTWQLVVSGLQNPVGMADPADGSGRLFILEQAGRVRILQDGDLLADPFLDISAKVGCCGERGLLGLAFHPLYTENGAFFINYTDLDGNSVIARYQVTPDDPNRANRDSETVLLYVNQPYGNHNGGSVVFGPEGYLYLGLGDGGSANDPHDYGQNTSVLLGKILRIDVDEGELYAIPPDNPFVNGGGLPEIWAYGLRNPWRFSFDRLTGDLYIGDVGQNQWEEVDYLPVGSLPAANFGWSYREGEHEFKGSPPIGVQLIDPVAEYTHAQGCSVTGGFVYRGSDLPEWRGVYLYGDYCSGNVWGLLHTPEGDWQNALLFQTGTQISSFGEDQNGEVYLLDYAGTLFRLSHGS